MAYEFGDIRISQEIFYYLLEHHELREDEEALLFKAYAEQEEIQNLVKSQGEAALPDPEGGESFPRLFQGPAEKRALQIQFHG